MKNHISRIKNQTSPVSRKRIKNHISRIKPLQSAGKNQKSKPRNEKATDKSIISSFA